MRCRHRLCSCAAVICTHSSLAVAEQLPLWEAGVGVAGISFPDYRGTARHRNYLLPVPVFIYRGNIFQVDREKVRGLLMLAALRLPPL